MANDASLLTNITSPWLGKPRNTASVTASKNDPHQRRLLCYILDLLSYTSVTNQFTVSGLPGSTGDFVTGLYDSDDWMGMAIPLSWENWTVHAVVDFDECTVTFRGHTALPMDNPTVHEWTVTGLPEDDDNY